MKIKNSVISQACDLFLNALVRNSSAAARKRTPTLAPFRTLALTLVASLTLAPLSASAKFQMTKSSSHERRIPKVTLTEIQSLDGETQALMMTLDSSAQNQRTPPEKLACEPSKNELRQRLAKDEETLDQKISDFVAVRVHAQGPISIADPNWPRSCERDCHCAVYKSILEAAGAERLAEGDRRIYQDLTALAMNQSTEQRMTCGQANIAKICSGHIR